MSEHEVERDWAGVNLADAEAVVAHALDRYHPAVALASSFSMEDCILMDLLARRRKDARVFALDTGRLNPETYECAEAMGAPPHCDFHCTSFFARGPLVVSIASGGHTPALSAALRRRLEAAVGSGWQTAACRMAEARGRLGPGPARRALMKAITADAGLMDALARNDHRAIRARIVRLAGRPGGARRNHEKMEGRATRGRGDGPSGAQGSGSQ
ncbi:MAG: hypothetical protein BWK77_05950 [Verrucomicrobia bacterium A1]|nr:MAG: hypothetical protein BWK77_05950 [Verrucomicrobia bacterium A1]